MSLVFSVAKTISVSKKKKLAMLWVVASCKGTVHWSGKEQGNNKWFIYLFIFFWKVAMLLPMIRLPVIKERVHMVCMCCCETSMVMESDLKNFINFFTFQLISPIAHNHSIAPSYPSHPFYFLPSFYSCIGMFLQSPFCSTSHSSWTTMQPSFPSDLLSLCLYGSAFFLSLLL